VPNAKRDPAGTQCREPEVRTISRRVRFANFGFKSGTRIIELLVSSSIPKFAQRSLQMLANFGIGTLAGEAIEILSRLMILLTLLNASRCPATRAAALLVAHPPMGSHKAMLSDERSREGRAVVIALVHARRR